MRFAFISAPRPTYLILSFLLGAFFSSCGNDSSWAKKEWNNTLAHYNIFFNGEQKWLETYQTVRESYKDDFRKPIELFNYGSLESLQGNLSAMDEVVKKASTMIDKYPKSKWVDDAYLLNGKAYLFKGDAIAAINLFDFVSNQNKDLNVQFQAKLWSVRALLLQNKVIDAEAMAANILKNPKLPKELLHVAQFTLGAIYHKQKKYQQSAELIQKALPRITDRMDCYRSYFALGQAYQKTGDYAKAERAFAKVPRFNPPYDITFNSQIEQVGILSAQQRDFAKANKILNRMLKDDKNLEYKGQIYYRMALNELDAGNTEKALETLKISIQESQTDKNQKTTSYLKIGDVYYQQRAYFEAGLYYDSANRVLDETHPDFEAILAKNQIVTDLLEHLVRISQNDSFLRLAQDESFLKEKIKTAKRKEKEAADKAKELADRAKNASAPNPFNSSPGMPVNPNMGGGGNSGGSSFPFYNVVTRKNGLTEFKRLFGDRPNVDFWKYANKMQMNSNAANRKTDPDTDNPDKDSSGNKVEPLSDRLKNIAQEDRKYYQGIPFEPKEQEILLQGIENSLFQSAGIYAEKLNEYETAQNQYLSLLRRFHQSQFAPQSLYELIKIHRIQNQPSLARLYTDTLKTRFPESIYVRMLDNPDVVINAENPESENNEIIQKAYDSMVLAFQAHQFNEAIRLKLNTDKRFSGNYLQPRFDFVYGLCLLEKDSAKAIETFKQLVLDYPKTDVSERAKSLLESLDKRSMALLPDSLKTNNAQTSLFTLHKTGEKLDALLVLPKESNINIAKAMISDLNKKEFSFDNLVLGRNIPLGDSYLLLIENFENAEKTKFYVSYLQQQVNLFNSKGIFKYQALTISQSNLQKLVNDKNIDAYVNWYQSQVAN